MRLTAPFLACALLLASAPAWAQRASLADRVAALEARAANPQANVDLLNQITQLRSEIQALRAQVEELQQQNRQLEETAKAQYLDLDGRINRLEGGTLPAAPAASLPAPPPAASRPATAAAPTSAERAPAVYGDAGRGAAVAGERESYEAAFAQLKAGQYVESARLFQAFLGQYPAGIYAPNALYWLGQSYYVTRNYELALPQFEALVERYPTHDKAADGLLKVGLSQQALDRLDAAERTLGEVTQRYAGSDAARTAADRLSAMRLSRVR